MKSIIYNLCFGQMLCYKLVVKCVHVHRYRCNKDTGLKDTSRDIWILVYVKGDDVYVQADKRHANINLDTAGYDIYKSKYNKSQLEELMK